MLLLDGSVPDDRPVVLVVGGTSGIGLATARLLAGPDHDARLAIGARDRSALDRAGAALATRALLVTCDLTDDASVVAAVEQVRAAHGRLDAVVTTAQVMAYGTVEEVPGEILDTVVTTAVQGTASLARAVLPVFREQGHGTLVVVSSLLARIAVPGMGAYNAAKWGQLGLVRAMQMELRRERDIHVCLVSPGAVDTPIYAQAASYAGRAGSAPPPVVSAERVAAAVVACLDKPRRHTDVGPANLPAVLAFRVLTPLYDRLAPLLARRVVFRGPALAEHSGNVLEAHPEMEAESGGWSFLGRVRGAARRARRLREKNPR